MEMFFILILLSVTGLSGCVEENNNYIVEDNNYIIENKFVGTWQTGSGISRSAITFFSDGTGSLASGSTVWMIKNGKLVVYWGEGIALTYNYSFSNGDTILTLIDVNSDLTTVYTKQQY